MCVHKPNNKTIEGLLSAIDDGDDNAMTEFIAAIYPELKPMAHFQMVGERSDHT